MNSPTLEMADGLRALPDAEIAAKAHELHTAAREEALGLIQRLRGVADASAEKPNSVGAVLACHLDCRGLEGSILRHAMIHAGMFLDAETDEKFERCPQCGKSLKD